MAARLHSPCPATQAESERCPTALRLIRPRPDHTVPAQPACGQPRRARHVRWRCRAARTPSLPGGPGGPRRRARGRRRFPAPGPTAAARSQG